MILSMPEFNHKEKCGKASAGSCRECERKYMNANLDEVRASLRELGALTAGAHFETNFVLDDAGGNFLATRRLARVRKQEFAHNTRCFFTLKLPLASGSEEHGCKVREELEVETDNCGTLLRMLYEMGFSTIAVYEKVRESWQLDLPSGHGVAKVDLDILPFMQVVEIEGNYMQIDSAAELLRLDKLQISTKSYHMLHQEWLTAKGMEPAYDILFDLPVKSHLRQYLGLSD